MKTLKRWRPAITTAALLLSSGAWAASVQPTTVLNDNFTSCSQLGIPGLIGGSSQTSPADGQVYQLGGGQTITFDYNPNGQKDYVDFTATVPMEYVVIKAGSGYNIFHYVPPVTADTQLYGPDNNGTPADVSHVVFCFKPRAVAEKTASASWARDTQWVLEKTATPTSINMFEGDSHDVKYTVVATPQTRNIFKVTGSVTISDPWGGFSLDGTIVDSMRFDTNDNGSIDAGDAAALKASWPAQADDVGTLTCPAGTGLPKTCSYTFTLDQANYPYLTANLFGRNAVAAPVKRQGVQSMATDTADFNLPSSPSPDYGTSISITDPLVAGSFNADWNDSLADRTFQYTHTFSCNDKPGYTNTATGVFSTGAGPTGGSASDTATVTITCGTFDITKSATTSFKRRYTWDAQKWLVVSAADAKVVGYSNCAAAPIADGSAYDGQFLCREAALTLNPGGWYDTVYRLEANRTVEDDFAFTVGGNIDITWTAGLTPDFDPAAPVDVLHFTDGIGGTQAVTVSCDPMGATSLHCSYTADLPRDSVPGYNLASITRTKKCYDHQGNATDCGPQSKDSNQAALTYGDPVAEYNACADLSDTFNSVAGTLNGGMTFGFVPGNKCTSFGAYFTGDQLPADPLLGDLDILASWMLPGQIADGTCAFVVPNKLTVAFGGTSANSTATASVNVPKQCEQSGCTYTQGYWKTHVNYAPKLQFGKKRDVNWDLINDVGYGGDNEDTVFYKSGLSFIQVMWTPPKGNPYYNLAHQYIAAKLNVLAGASDADVAADLAQAEAWFNSYAPNNGFWKKNQNVITIAGHLASFNEGSTGPGHCSVSGATLAASQ